VLLLAEAMNLLDATIMAVAAPVSAPTWSMAVWPALARLWIAYRHDTPL
jgi:hypothetical protein